MNVEKKIKRFAEKEIYRNLDLIIFDDIDGDYWAFGKYRLSPTDRGCAVYDTMNKCLGTFNSKRVALAWCIACKNKNHHLATVISTLDSKKSMLDADVACGQALIRKSHDPEFIDLALAKLDNKIKHQDQVSGELEKCLNLAKYMQLKGFKNETARVSPK